MAILELKNVSKSFGDTPVLKNINLSVEDGEFVAILGFSGTGKTTLMSLLAGLETPDQGQALHQGKPIAAPDPSRALIFQSYALMPWLTAASNVGLAVNAVHGGKSRADRAALVDKYLAMVGLSHARDRRPSELSGRMR